MTINYSYACSKSGFATFLRLLGRWRGSIYKLIYKESIIYLAVFYGLSLTYKFALSDTQKIQFEKLVIFCDKSANFIPITFILGFYVSQVVHRWWEIYMSIAWPDKTVELISTHVKGNSEEARMIRRAMARYLNCSQLLVLRDITAAVRKRFPTLDHLVEAGFLTLSERDKLEAIECDHHKYFVPLHWCNVILCKARQKNLIGSDYFLQKILERVSEYRNCVGMLLSYDWIPVPLVYTQVVTIAVYSYVLATVIGFQTLDPEKKEKDMETFFPVFPFLHFLFYMGWLKVAEALLNPLGEDDDDFEVNYIVDRNLQIGYLIVDTLYDDAPEPEKDIHWDQDLAEIPHTIASVGLKTKAHKGSTSKLNVSEPDQTLIFPPGPITRQISSQRSYPPTSKHQFSVKIPRIAESEENIPTVDRTDTDTASCYESITGLNIIDLNNPKSIERNRKSWERLPRKIRNQIRRKERESRRGSPKPNIKARRTESSKSAPPGVSAEKFYGAEFSAIESGNVGLLSHPDIENDKE